MTPSARTVKRTWSLAVLGTIAYRDALSLQHRLLAAVRDKTEMGMGVVLLLEHLPVFTLGRRGGLDHLCVSEAFLRSSGFQLVHVERGGDITYHGPGQLVVYPIADLRAMGMGVVDFVTGLEEIMIRTAADWNIAAGRDARNRGVWAGPRKLGSIGSPCAGESVFTVSRLNVNTDLTPFHYIHPCGLENVAMTSMENELSEPVSMASVRRKLAAHMADVFAVTLTQTDVAQLKKSLALRNECRTKRNAVLYQAQVSTSGGLWCRAVCRAIV